MTNEEFWKDLKLNGNQRNLSNTSMVSTFVYLCRNKSDIAMHYFLMFPEVIFGILHRLEKYIEEEK